MLTPGAMSPADYETGRYRQNADLAKQEREFWEAKERGYYVGRHGWKVDVHPGDRPPSDCLRIPAINGRDAHQLDMMNGIKYCQQVTCVCGNVTGWRWVPCTPEQLNSPAYCDDCQPPPDDPEPVTPEPTPVTPPGCQHCGRPVTHPQAKYCTGACRQAAYRARHQASTSPSARARPATANGIQGSERALPSRPDLPAPPNPAPGHQSDTPLTASESTRRRASAQRQVQDVTSNHDSDREAGRLPSPGGADGSGGLLPFPPRRTFRGVV